MIDLIKCAEFIKLQNMINADIDRNGETTLEKADKLDRMLDRLTDEEMDFMLSDYIND